MSRSTDAARSGRVTARTLGPCSPRPAPREPCHIPGDNAAQLLTAASRRSASNCTARRVTSQRGGREASGATNFGAARDRGCGTGRRARRHAAAEGREEKCYQKKRGGGGYEKKTEKPSLYIQTLPSPPQTAQLHRAVSLRAANKVGSRSCPYKVYALRIKGQISKS